MSIKELSPLFKLRNYVIDSWRDDKKYFLGKVLTIIDASIADPQQRKGIKDLIENAFWEQGSDWREQNMREILIKFSEKYCPDLMPKTNDETDVFIGKVSIVCSDAPSPDYFN